MKKGIDISKYNIIKDTMRIWMDGYETVIIKATNGFVIDPRLDAHFNMFFTVRKLFPKVKFNIGFYHYPKFTNKNDGAKEAMFFLNAVSPYLKQLKGTHVNHHLDVEHYYVTATRQRYNVNLTQWITVVENADPHKPGIYSSYGEWARMTGNHPYGKAYGDWVASWTAGAAPLLPVGWLKDNIRLWQVGIAGQHKWLPKSVAGVEGKVDVDYVLIQNPAETNTSPRPRRIRKSAR